MRKAKKAAPKKKKAVAKKKKVVAKKKAAPKKRVRCGAKTAAGRRCKRFTNGKSKFCSAHKKKR